MGHYVYKYVLNNEIVYIGKTDTTLKSRIRQHGKPGDNIPKNAWEDIGNAEVYFITLNNSTMSDVVESELIRRYKPKYNVAKKSDWSGLPFVEPKWIKYDPQLQLDKNDKATISMSNPIRNTRLLFVKRVKSAYKDNASARNILPYIIEHILNGQYQIVNASFLLIKAPESFDKKDPTFACYRDDKKVRYCKFVSSVIHKADEGLFLKISLKDGLDLLATCCDYVCKNAQQYYETTGTPLDEEYINAINLSLKKLNSLWSGIGI